jgi:hypothetical protein
MRKLIKLPTTIYTSIKNAKILILLHTSSTIPPQRTSHITMVADNLPPTESSNNAPHIHFPPTPLTNVDSTTDNKQHDPAAKQLPADNNKLKKRVAILHHNLCQHSITPISSNFNNIIASWYHYLLLHGDHSDNTTGMENHIFTAFGLYLSSNACNA